MRVPVPEVILPADRLGRVHFVGIGGAGLSAIARIMLARGVAVSGSDGVASPTLERLRELGCTLAQGYHLSRPVPAEELEAWLERRRAAPEYPGPLWTATA